MRSAAARALVDQPQRREYSPDPMARTQGGYMSLRISKTLKKWLEKAARRRGLKLATWMKSVAMAEAEKILGEPAPDLGDEPEEAEGEESGE